MRKLTRLAAILSLVAAGCSPALINVKAPAMPAIPEARSCPPALPPVELPKVAATTTGCPSQFAACYDEKNFRNLIDGIQRLEKGRAIKHS